MKNLANCDPVEFLVQSNKIRHHVERWLNVTKILDIRKAAPKFTDGMSDEEQKEAVSYQIRKNISAMLDAALEEHPVETAELLCLCCFIDPADVKNHTFVEFLPAISDLLNSSEVIGFFTSLARLGDLNIFASPNL